MASVPQAYSVAIAAILLGCNGFVRGETPGNIGDLPGTGFGTAGNMASGGASTGAGGSNAMSGLDCSHPAIPTSPMRRLTRAQYTNSIKAIFGVEVDATALAADERAGGYSSNFSAAIDDLGTELYSTMAESVSAQAAQNLAQLDPCAATGDAACATKVIGSLGRRLYRRPLTSAEAARYQALFDQYGAAAAGGFKNGLRVVIQSMLQSPRFLYLVEPAATGAERQLNGFELAARLAAFVWSSAPDDALLDAAAAGKLDSQDGVRSQARAMLQDPRAVATLESFHSQWLGLEAIAAISKDPALFPGFSDEQRAAMLDETLSFVDYVFKGGDGKLETLLGAPYSFPKPALFSIYGLPASTPSDGHTPVMLDATQRAGVLTQPAFLAVNAHNKVSAPIKRGNVVLKNILCLTTPSPPAGVKTELPDAMIPTTQREQVKLHESNPACVGCHKGMDGIGLGFEAYDAVGAYRTMDAGVPVDATGEVIGTQSINGPFNGAVELAHKLGQSTEARACMTQQWYRFAVGRPGEDADGCALQALGADFTASGGDLRELVVAIATSPAFRNWGAPKAQQVMP